MGSRELEKAALGLRARGGSNAPVEVTGRPQGPPWFKGKGRLSPTHTHTSEKWKERV